MERRIELPPLELLEPLVAAVHDLWRHGQMKNGWTIGDDLDEVARTDPRLVAWKRMPPFERDHCLTSCFWSEILEIALRKHELVLEFSANELRAGEVAIGTNVVLKPIPGRPSLGSYTGVVTELQASPSDSGRMKNITVRWNDGDVLSYLPNELMVMP